MTACPNGRPCDPLAMPRQPHHLDDALKPDRTRVPPLTSLTIMDPGPPIRRSPRDEVVAMSLQVDPDIMRAAVNFGLPPDGGQRVGGPFFGKRAAEHVSGQLLVCRY
jgi:hypothetical protein